jgi:transcriptional regulator with XRE-family HTH domain
METGMDNAKKLSDFGKYMKMRGLSAQEVASALGLSCQYIYMWRRGACKPGWKVARAIEAWTSEKFGADYAFVVDRWVA